MKNKELEGLLRQESERKDKAINTIKDLEKQLKEEKSKSKELEDKVKYQSSYVFIFTKTSRRKTRTNQKIA